jgi:hypothetical protein
MSTKAVKKNLMKAQTIFAIGDSNVLPLKNLLLNFGDLLPDFFVRAEYIRGLCSDNLFDASGSVSETIENALSTVGFLTKDRHAPWLSLEPEAVSTSFAAMTPSITPILIVCCGDIDLRGYILPQFKNVYDFDMPDNSAPASDTSQRIPYEAVVEMLSARLGIITDLIANLQTRGYYRTFLACLPAPSMEDDAAFEAAHGFPCPLPLRVKLTTLANDILAERCLKSNIGFLDRRLELEVDGLLDRRYRLDGFHINEDGMALLVEEAVLRSSENSSAITNQGLYKHCDAQAADPSPNDDRRYSELRIAFQETGIIQFKAADASLLDSILSCGDIFESHVGNINANPYWFGPNRLPFTDSMKSAVPTAEMLHALYNFLYDVKNSIFFKAAIGYDPQFLSVRFFESNPHLLQPVGPQSFHYDGTPPGVMRALIYLTDVTEDSGPFEYQCTTGVSVKVVGEAGTVVIFDANRLFHRGSPPISRKRRVIDLCCAPRPHNDIRRVIWPGMNAWPHDPFLYPLHGCLTYPPSERFWVRAYPFAQRLNSHGRV